jgi:hypothetical protein
MSKQFKVNIINWSGQQLALNLNDSSTFLRHDGSWATPAGGPATAGGVTGISAAGAAAITGYIQVSGVSGIAVTQNNNTIIVGSSAGLSYMFTSGITSGVTKQFIAFPALLGSNPNVIATLENDYVDTIVPFQVSGANTSGFYAVFANAVNFTGYTLNVFAATTTMTGTVASITTNNNTYITSGFATVTGSTNVYNPNFIAGTGGISLQLSGGNSVIISDTTSYGTVGTGLPVYSGVSGTNSQMFYSTAASTGIRVTATQGVQTFSTFLGTQFTTGLQTNVKFTGSGFYFDLLSGTVGPGTYLALFNSMFATPSNANVRIVVKYWNGTNTTGIWGMTEGFTSSYTTGVVGGAVAGVSTSGFIESDFNSIITLPAASNIVGMSAAASATGCFALSGLLDYTTGASIGSCTSIQLLKLY